MSTTVPVQLKSIEKFIREAEKIKKIEPTISNICRLYAIQETMNIDGWQQATEIKKWLNIQLSLCEANSHLHTQNLWNDAKIKIINMANNIFKNADQIERAGNANKKTAVAFYSAHVFYEILKLNAFGSRSDTNETNERSEYCVSKAVNILKSINELTVHNNNMINAHEIKQNEKQTRILYRYNVDVISQLVDLKFGTRDECIAASKLCIDFNNINEVLDQLTRLKQQKQPINHKNSMDNNLENNIIDSSDDGSVFGEPYKFYNVIFRIDIPQKYLFAYENDKYKQQLLFSGFIRGFIGVNDVFEIILKYSKGVVNIISECDEAINIISENDKIKANDLAMDGAINYASNNLNKAIDIYTKAICYNPNDYYLFLMRSKCYIKLKKYEIALKDIEIALEIEPGSANCWYVFGLINLNLNNIKKCGVGFTIAMEMVLSDTNKKIFKFCNNEKQSLKLLIENGLALLFKAKDNNERIMEQVDDTVKGEIFFQVNKVRQDILINLTENDKIFQNLYSKFENKMNKFDENGNEESEINHMLEINEYVDLFESFLKHNKYKLYTKELKFYKLVQEAFYNHIEKLNKRQFRKSYQKNCFWFVTCTSLSKIKYNKRLFGILIMGTARDDNNFNDLVAKYTVYGEPTAEQLIQILKRTISCNISNDDSDGSFRFFIPRGIIFGDNIKKFKDKIINHFDSKYDEYPIEIMSGIQNYMSEADFWGKFQKQRQIQFPKWSFVGWNNLNMFKWNLIH